MPAAQWAELDVQELRTAHAAVYHRAGGEGVVDVRVKYFDTLPVAASLCITKTGLLFAGAFAVAGSTA